MIAVSTRGAGRVWRVKILRSPEAKSLAPSAEEATADQGPDGKICASQLNPARLQSAVPARCDSRLEGWPGPCQQLLWLSVCEGELGLLFDTLILFN